MSRRSDVLATAVWQLCGATADTGDCYVTVCAWHDPAIRPRWQCVSCLRGWTVYVPNMSEKVRALACLKERKTQRRQQVSWDKQTCFQMAQACAILALASPEDWKHDALREDFRTRNALAAMAANFLLERVLAEFGASRTEHRAVQAFLGELTAGLSTLEETTV